jgi:hypothetical protein
MHEVVRAGLAWTRSTLQRIYRLLEMSWRHLREAQSTGAGWVIRKCPWIKTRLLLSERLITWFVFGSAVLLLASKILKLDSFMDNAAYYYFFSTVAQSLASAFGFLVAVALYRLKTIEEGMEIDLGEVIERTELKVEKEILRRMNRCHFWDNMEQYIKEEDIERIPCDDVKSLVSSCWKNFRLGVEKVARLRVELVDTLGLTSLVIGSSVFLIPLSRYLKPDDCLKGFPKLALFLLCTLGFLACRCLWWYWDIAMHITDRKPRDYYKRSGLGTCATLTNITVSTESREQDNPSQ